MPNHLVSKGLWISANLFLILYFFIDKYWALNPLFIEYIKNLVIPLLSIIITIQQMEENRQLAEEIGRLLGENRQLAGENRLQILRENRPLAGENLLQILRENRPLAGDNRQLNAENYPHAGDNRQLDEENHPLTGDNRQLNAENRPSVGENPYRNSDENPNDLAEGMDRVEQFQNDSSKKIKELNNIYNKKK